MNNFLFLFLPTSLLCVCVGVIAGWWVAARRSAHVIESQKDEIKRLDEIRIRSEEQLKGEGYLGETFASKATQILSETAETSRETHSKILE